MQEEIWKDYPPYPDRYQVSNFGNVRSKPFIKKSSNKGGPYSFLTCKDISDKLGFKYHTIHKVLQRKNWKNVEPDGSKWILL